MLPCSRFGPETKCWVRSNHVNYLNVNFMKFGLLISAKQNVCHPVKTHGKKLTDDYLEKWTW